MEDIETLQLKENAMETKSIVLLGAAALSISMGALAGKIPAIVVSIYYSMQENDPETWEKTC